MKILLDTHIIIWAISNSPKLSQTARDILLNPKNDIYFSVLSLWEIELKRLSKPEKMPFSAELTFDYCIQAGYTELPLKEQSIFELNSLSFPEDKPKHKDPFDHMLLCQAISEEMLLITHDSKIRNYQSNNIKFV